jgi:hypothetical protein
MISPALTKALRRVAVLKKAGIIQGLCDFLLTRFLSNTSNTLDDCALAPYRADPSILHLEDELKRKPKSLHVSFTMGKRNSLKLMW